MDKRKKMILIFLIIAAGIIAAFLIIGEKEGLSEDEKEVESTTYSYDEDAEDLNEQAEEDMEYKEFWIYTSGSNSETLFLDGNTEMFSWEKYSGSEQERWVEGRWMKDEDGEKTYAIFYIDGEEQILEYSSDESVLIWGDKKFVKDSPEEGL